ncbi:MAG: ABC transporter permease [Bryobacteraceae bacterium]|nr:ABC transporter permease [Bryobacteraceae bacterium]
MDRFLFELRLAARRMAAQPGFTAIALLSLGVGIGATTIFFSLMNSTLLKPLPVERPNELVAVVEPRFKAPVTSHPNYRDLRDRNQVLSGLAAYRIVPLNASLGGGRNSRMWGYLVSGDYFDVLGVKAVTGRVLTPADNVNRGGHPVAVISHLAWQRRFAGDPNIAGRTIKLNGMPYTILGVTPPGFIGVERFYAAEIFIPDMMTAQIEPGATYLDRRGDQNTFMVGRLKQGVSEEQAEANLNAIAAQLAKDYPKENEGMRFTLLPPGWAGGFLRGPVIGFTSILVGVAALMLIVVCINLTSLLLARAAERRRETAVRLAIGASRGQLIRQLLFESLLLAVAGGMVGVMLAYWGVSIISGARPPVDFALETTVQIDYRVLLFSLALTLATSVVLGLAPAVQSANTDLAAAIKNDATSERRRRWPVRDILVGAQITLSVLLLAASGLMLKSLRSAMEVDLGFRPKGAVAAGFDLALQGYSEERGKAFQKQILDRLRAMPGVESAAYLDFVPLDLGMSNTGVYPDGQPEPPASQTPLAQVFTASSGAFRTLGTKLLAGREFDERDTKEAPRVLIVNRTFTANVLKVKDPAEAVGKRVRSRSRVWQIAGVVEDGKYLALAEAPKPVMFFAASQDYTSIMRLVARTQGDERELLNRVRSLILEMDPDMAIYSAETLEEHMNLPLLPTRIAAISLAAFGGVTMLLAAIGIYGVMAFAVARRTREIGIRVAVGATPRQVMRAVFGKTAWLVGAASAAGVILAMLAGGLLAPVLIGVDPRDPLAHSAGVAAMAAVALLACWVPARRAIGIDPIRALRQD